MISRLLLAILAIQITTLAQPINQWQFTATVNTISSEGGITLPNAPGIGAMITGTFTLDYADAGEPYVAPFIRRYPNQPVSLITASLEGVLLSDATTSFRHDVEVWNNSEWHEGHDLFFMGYQTLGDSRWPGLEVSMSLSGSDQNGLTVSSTALPTSFGVTDFGGLSFGYGIIDPSDVSRSFQLGGPVTSITPIPEPSSTLLLLAGAAFCVWCRTLRTH